MICFDPTQTHEQVRSLQVPQARGTKTREEKKKKILTQNLRSTHRPQKAMLGNTDVLCSAAIMPTSLLFDWIYADNTLFYGCCLYFCPLYLKHTLISGPLLLRFHVPLYGLSKRLTNHIFYKLILSSSVILLYPQMVPKFFWVFWCFFIWMQKIDSLFLESRSFQRLI